MDDIRVQLQAIEQRNRLVETDKAWETSLTRRAFIAFITYCTASLFLWLVGVTLPFVNALVPAGGYLVSTLSLPWIKVWWIKKFSRHTERLEADISMD